MSYVFICHSHKNNDYAYALAGHLQQKGFNIWIDRLGIGCGVNWWDAILKGLRGCGALAVVMTPESRDSEWVNLEIFIAKGLGKPILPLLLNGDNWELFVLTQYADVRNSSMPDDSFLTELSRHITPRKQAAGEDKSSLTPERREFAEASPPHFDIGRARADFQQAYNDRNWSDALEILGSIRASGETLSDFNPDEYERNIFSERVAAVIGNPFEWIKIPRGVVVLEDASDYFPPGTRGGSFDTPAFAIAKYPVTVAQYGVFVDDGGYSQKDYWTKTGWEWKRKEKIVLPRYWEDEKWHKPIHPVVGVSWYEAAAFCLWLSAKTGQNIRLPTEQQWQRATQGDTSRLYPWGDEFDKSQCNFNTKGTTSVVEHPNGASLYGVMDMSGNISEWCLTEWGTDSNDLDGPNSLRVLRGGSWKDTVTIFLRSAFRLGGNPADRDNYCGFRCAYY